MRLRRGEVAALVVAGSVGTMVATYLTVGRRPCLTWGATEEEVARPLPGDTLMPDPDVVSTRAVTVRAPASAVWPWLVQMGSGRGGVYTYDWIENLAGLHMHSTDRILPEFQNRAVGDVERLGTSGPVMRVAELDRERAMVRQSDRGDWVWAFCLSPLDHDRTRLISRNRMRVSGSPVVGLRQTLVMEPGSLIMERKMLQGIGERAERLWRSGAVHDAA